MFGNDALNPHLEFLITSSLFRYIRIQIISRLSKAEEEEVGDDKQKGCVIDVLLAMSHLETNFSDFYSIKCRMLRVL